MILLRMKLRQDEEDVDEDGRPKFFYKIEYAMEHFIVGCPQEVLPCHDWD